MAALDVGDWFKSQWLGTIDLLQQQLTERLRSAVTVYSAAGEVLYVQQLAPTTVQEITTRHADTPIIEMDHRNRALHPRFFVWSTVVDDEDKVRLMLDPTSIYNTNAAAGFARKVDSVVLGAAIGTALTGKGGTTSTVFPAAFQIASGGVGLTKAKMIEAMSLLQANENPGPFYMAISSGENADLLGITEVASRDFNNGMPLTDGKVPAFMGFTFIHSEQLVVSGGVRSVIAWSKPSLALGIWKDREANIAKDPTKNYNYRPHLKQFVGATRLDEVGVVEILCA